MIIENFHSESAWTAATVKLILSLKPQTIALSGGSTPSPIYKALSQNSGQIQFYQVDERYIPKNHPESNFKLIQETLKPKNFYYFDTSLPIGKCLKHYEKTLPATLDLCILGIGPDGHTASLFPHSKDLTTKAKVAHTQSTQFAAKDRLTITFPTILKSKTLLVLLKDKPEILKELETPSKSEQEFPALKLLNHKDLQIIVLTTRP
ncbi:6-phosphogluconolactonase [Candidatus Peregrinibacteria bacterium]|nr:6-phosphogluconolactonase [Candidatus Peregrinibacteria bacterium]